ncbi:hypothetical protein EKO27_g9876 [Xylaria grammica]|uniref:Rhodopsin domain-containing protein n=1 Tax=Xylaria grammica TaxID=363999 RepID=A0A439CSV7_9PEZI|nr:hypothetical protein EKO27_g9876 [Xylaria grammica]
MPGAVTPTPEEIAWMLSRPHDSVVPNIIACGIITFTFSTLFISLRLWSRKIVRGRFALDASDWFAVAAWSIYVPFIVTFILVTRYGGGRHAVFIADPRLLGIVRNYTMWQFVSQFHPLQHINHLLLTTWNALQLYIVQENLYAATLACLKFSILSLYRTLFGSSRTFHLCTWAVGALVAEWFLQVVLATNLQCVPLSASWDPDAGGTCINYGVEALVAYIINISTDIIILSMPIPLVLKLNTSKTQKRRLIISFAAGGSACLVSLAQLAYITKLGNDSDSSWSVVPSSLLGAVELMVGFLATSIATYRPLYQFVFVERMGRSSGSAADTEPTPYHISYQKSQFRRDVLVGTGGVSGDFSSESQRGIVVTSHIELTRHNNPPGTWIRVDDGP